jgi:cobalamin biosynthesis protein CobT
MSDDFVHINDTTEKQTTEVVETVTEKTENSSSSSPSPSPSSLTQSESEATAMNEQLGKFFTSILNPESEIKENNDIISNLLGGLLRNLIKNNVNKNEEEDDGDDEEENSENESESESESESDSEKEESCQSDEDKNSESDKEESDEDKNSDSESESECSDSDYTEMFIILENNKSYNYATSYPRARRTMLARFHRFLEKNSSNYMRIEKESERIVVYERQPNTLSPFDEQLLYHIEFFSVEKYTDS